MLICDVIQMLCRMKNKYCWFHSCVIVSGCEWLVGRNECLKVMMVAIIDSHQPHGSDHLNSAGFTRISIVRLDCKNDVVYVSQSDF
jgi:hypothetical protein